MPYLRMYLDEKQLDEIFISEIFFQSVLGNHIIEEEKQALVKKHKKLIRGSQQPPLFVIDKVSSAINDFTPLQLKKDRF